MVRGSGSHPHRGARRVGSRSRGLGVEGDALARRKLGGTRPPGDRAVPRPGAGVFPGGKGVFAALPRSAFSIRVGFAASSARFNVESFADVLEFPESLVAAKR